MAEAGQRDLGLPGEQPADDEITEGHQQPRGVGRCRSGRFRSRACSGDPARKPCMAATMPSTSSVRPVGHGVTSLRPPEARTSAGRCLPHWRRSP